MVVYESSVSDVTRLPWHGEPCLVGVDEAGRGPVLGPMVYAIAVSPISNSQALKQREFADSKVLSAQKRDELFQELIEDETICCFVDEISPIGISGLMLAPDKVSLNTIAYDSTCKLIQQALQANIDVREIYVDTVGDASSYQTKLSQRFPGIKFTVKPKADALFPIVSAASIAAKVSRDRCIEKLGPGVGSGYPADPKTKQYLTRACDRVFGFQPSVRFSWGTADKIILNQCVSVQWECDDDQGQNQQQSLLQNGGAGKKIHPPTKKRAARHSYFSSRRMQKGFSEQIMK